jgi:hypothetical protein
MPNNDDITPTQIRRARENLLRARAIDFAPEGYDNPLNPSERRHHIRITSDGGRSWFSERAIVMALNQMSPQERQAVYAVTSEDALRPLSTASKLTNLRREMTDTVARRTEEAQLRAIDMIYGSGFGGNPLGSSIPYGRPPGGLVGESVGQAVQAGVAAVTGGANVSNASSGQLSTPPPARPAPAKVPGKTTGNTP